MVYIYCLYISIITVSGLLVIIHPHLKGKSVNKERLGYSCFLSCYVLHDFYMSLINPKMHFVTNNIEIFFYYLIVWIILLLFFKGKSFINFVKTFAIDFIYQALGSVFAVLVIGMTCDFDMQTLVKRIDTPLFSNCFYFFINIIIISGVLLFIFKMILHKENIWIDIVATLLTLVSIATTMINNEGSLYLVIPIFFIVLIAGVFYQERQLLKAKKQEQYYIQLENQQKIRQEELAKIRHDIANHINVIETSGSNQYGEEVLQYIDKEIENVEKYSK